MDLSHLVNSGIIVLILYVAVFFVIAGVAVVRIFETYEDSSNAYYVQHSDIEKYKSARNMLLCSPIWPVYIGRKFLSFDKKMQDREKEFREEENERIRRKVRAQIQREERAAQREMDRKLNSH